MPRKASGTLVRDGSMLAGRHLTIANSDDEAQALRQAAGVSTLGPWRDRKARRQHPLFRPARL